MAQRDVVVLSGVRTAVGTFGGAFKDTPAVDMAAAVVRDSVARAKIDPAQVGHVAFGHVVNTDVRDMYLARMATINGGLPKEVPAFNVNRLCGSGPAGDRIGVAVDPAG